MQSFVKVEITEKNRQKYLSYIDKMLDWVKDFETNTKTVPYTTRNWCLKKVVRFKEELPETFFGVSYWVHLDGDVTPHITDSGELCRQLGSQVKSNNVVWMDNEAYSMFISVLRKADGQCN